MMKKYAAAALLVLGAQGVAAGIVNTGLQGIVFMAIGCFCLGFFAAMAMENNHGK